MGWIRKGDLFLSDDAYLDMHLKAAGPPFSQTTSVGGRNLVQQMMTDPNEKTDVYSFLQYKDGNVHPVIVMPVTKDGNFIMLRQFRHGAMNTVLEWPGGNQNPRENVITPAEIARYHLLRETGYKAGRLVFLSPDWRPVPWGYFDPATYRTGFVPALALDCELVAQPKPGSNEFAYWNALSPAGAYSLMQRRELRDAKTVMMLTQSMILLGHMVFNEHATPLYDLDSVCFHDAADPPETNPSRCSI